MTLDETHDSRRSSWIEAANVAGCDFPIQNLPFGVFSHPRVPATARVGVAIGDRVLDVAPAADALGLVGDAAVAASTCRDDTLNALAMLGRPHWKALRLVLSRAF